MTPPAPDDQLVQVVAVAFPSEAVPVQKVVPVIPAVVRLADRVEDPARIIWPQTPMSVPVGPYTCDINMMPARSIEVTSGNVEVLPSFCAVPKIHAVGEAVAHCASQPADPRSFPSPVIPELKMIATRFGFWVLHMQSKRFATLHVSDEGADVNQVEEVDDTSPK